MFDELLGERTAGAFGDQRILAAQFHATGESVSGFAVCPDAHVTCCHSDDGIVVAIKDFGGCESWINLNA